MLTQTNLCESSAFNTLVHGYVRNWYLISEEGDCGEGEEDEQIPNERRS